MASFGFSGEQNIKLLSVPFFDFQFKIHSFGNFQTRSRDDLDPNCALRTIIYIDREITQLIHTFQLHLQFQIVRAANKSQFKVMTFRVSRTSKTDKPFSHMGPRGVVCIVFKSVEFVCELDKLASF